MKTQAFFTILAAAIMAALSVAPAQAQGYSGLVIDDSPSQNYRRQRGVAAGPADGYSMYGSAGQSGAASAFSSGGNPYSFVQGSNADVARQKIQDVYKQRAAVQQKKRDDLTASSRLMQQNAQRVKQGLPPLAALPTAQNPAGSSAAAPAEMPATVSGDGVSYPFY